MNWLINKAFLTPPVEQLLGRQIDSWTSKTIVSTVIRESDNNVDLDAGDVYCGLVMYYSEADRRWNNLRRQGRNNSMVSQKTSDSKILWWLTTSNPLILRLLILPVQIFPWRDAMHEVYIALNHIDRFHMTSHNFRSPYWWSTFGAKF